MSKKKILMCIILLIFVACIGTAIFLINDKSVKASEESANSKETATAQEEKVDILEITDNYFIEQTNDIYLNLNDYVGKTVKMQGFVYTYLGEDGNTYYAVVRNTPRMLSVMTV